MAASDEKKGFIATMLEGVSAFSRIMVGTLLPSITDGTEIVMQSVEERVLRMERRILRKMTSFCIYGLGGLFLLVALFFALTELLGWSNAGASFSIGVFVVMIGLLLKAGEPGR